MERIDYIHARSDTPALIEEYIEGRELYVGVLGNEKAIALPIVEMDLSKLPRHAEDRGRRSEVGGGHRGLQDADVAFFPEDLDDEVIKRVQDTALQAFQALQLRDYGRIDFGSRRTARSTCSR
jgi:D-alanine-D-alanine ligase